MDRTSAQWTFHEGDEVVAADGDKVGKVVAVHRDYVVVEKGFFFPTDYYIPTRAITTYDDGKIHLNVTKAAALAQGWETVPTATEATATTAGETLRVPVHEEELTATTREREVGQVRIDKEVVVEEQTMEVPVTDEQVRVERHLVDRATGPSEGAFEEETIAVPIRGEEVDLQKRTRVAEELEIEKEAVPRTETVEGTVRREEVHVDETGAATRHRGQGKRRS